MLTISEIWMNGDTPHVSTNGRVTDVALGPTATLEELQREACRLNGEDFSAWLFQQPIILCATIVGESFPDKAATDMDRMQGKFPAKTEMVSAILTAETWMEAMRDRAIAMCGEIQAGTRTSASREDFNTIGAAPVNYFQIVELSKQ